MRGGLLGRELRQPHILKYILRLPGQKAQVLLGQLVFISSSHLPPLAKPGEPARQGCVLLSRYRISPKFRKRIFVRHSIPPQARIFQQNAQILRKIFFHFQQIAEILPAQPLSCITGCTPGTLPGSGQPAPGAGVGGSPPGPVPAQAARRIQVRLSPGPASRTAARWPAAPPSPAPDGSAPGALHPPAQRPAAGPWAAAGSGAGMQLHKPFPAGWRHSPTNPPGWIVIVGAG